MKNKNLIISVIAFAVLCAFGGGIYFHKNSFFYESKLSQQSAVKYKNNNKFIYELISKKNQILANKLNDRSVICIIPKNYKSFKPTHSKQLILPPSDCSEWCPVEGADITITLTNENNTDTIGINFTEKNFSKKFTGEILCGKHKEISCLLTECITPIK